MLNFTVTVCQVIIIKSVQCRWLDEWLEKEHGFLHHQTHRVRRAFFLFCIIRLTGCFCWVSYQLASEKEAFMLLMVLYQTHRVLRHGQESLTLLRCSSGALERLFSVRCFSLVPEIIITAELLLVIARVLLDHRITIPLYCLFGSGTGRF
jgi:hypothetical protein